MAGPVPTYLATQLAAQNAFSVPFGLVTLVNTAITNATAAGEFDTTIDCSLFPAEDVSNLRIYLDSEGYLVELAKNDNNKSLLIDWSRFLDIPGTEVIVDQGTRPWIFQKEESITATITVVTVTTSPTVLLPANNSRKSFSIQCKDKSIYIALNTTVSTSIYSWYILKLNILDRDDYLGPVTAVVDSGTATVLVTELI